MTTVLDLLLEHGVPHRSDGSAAARGWAESQCPQCSGANYLGINLRYGNFSCWRCGPLDRLETFAALTGLPRAAAWRALKALGGPTRSLGAPTPPTGRLVLPQGVGALKKAHRRYLEGRGYDPAQLEKLWGVQGIGIAPRLSWRIFLPVTLRGRVVSWTTRALTDQEPRYVSASKEEEEVNHKTLLWGEDYARHAVIVCEGPFDVMRIGPGAVATLGTGFSRVQVARIARFPVRVVCFDNEPEAQRRATRLCEALKISPGTTDQVVLDAPDPGSASKREVRTLRKIYLER